MKNVSLFSSKDHEHQKENLHKDEVNNEDYLYLEEIIKSSGVQPQHAQCISKLRLCNENIMFIFTSSCSSSHVKPPVASFLYFSLVSRSQVHFIPMHSLLKFASHSECFQQF